MAQINVDVTMSQPGEHEIDAATVEGVVDLRIEYRTPPDIETAEVALPLYKLSVERSGHDSPKLTLTGPRVNGVAEITILKLMEVMINETQPEKEKVGIPIESSNPGPVGNVAGYLEEPNGQIIQVMAYKGEAKDVAMQRVKAKHPNSKIVLSNPHSPEKVDSISDSKLPEHTIPLPMEDLTSFEKRIREHGMTLRDWMKSYAAEARSRVPQARIWNEL